VAKGVLERRERRILWIFPSRSFPLADAAAEQQARERIRAVILNDQPADKRTVALIGLVRAGNLIDEIFAPHERSQANRRIAEMTSEDAVNDGLLGDGLDTLLMAVVLGATILYAHQMLNRPDDYDSDWNFSSATTWDTAWTEPSSAADTGRWEGGSVESSWGSDAGGGDSGGSSDSGSSSSSSSC
jgi:hypothetical protein